MPQSGVDKIPPGPKLDALTAEKVFGWRKVHKRQGALSGCVRNFMQPPDKIQVASGEGVQIKNFVAALRAYKKLNEQDKQKPDICILSSYPFGGM